ncbi:hypothetical protein V6N13_117686 [Hibiscus sabdariffa]|uniref:Uncharacterized protein n=1 Tax=Hibiscus sabdariffa TaxID=183260 RepID=A0ABR2PBB4_9ROSI
MMTFRPGDKEPVIGTYRRCTCPLVDMESAATDESTSLGALLTLANLSTISNPEAQTDFPFIKPFFIIRVPPRYGLDFSPYSKFHILSFCSQFAAKLDSTTKRLLIYPSITFRFLDR